jgi:hypothetical protein
MKKLLQMQFNAGFWGKWMMLIYTFEMLAACAPVQTVYIPPEWRQAAPVTGVTEAPKEREAEKFASQPLVRPAPSIREMDMPDGNDQGTSDSSAVVQEGAAINAEPQYLASMHLVDQARASLAQGSPDSAINFLEQAIQVDVYNGEAFLGLARAWKMKGTQEKALEFANKAEILFQDNPQKLKQVYLLKAEMFRELRDTAGTDYYLQKASRL